MNKLAQYYTDQKISNLLISFISKKKPKNILELGIGQGSLSSAALLKWRNANLIGCELDQESIINLTLKFPNIKIHQINGLSTSLHKHLGLKNESIDVAICNPPYLKIQNKKKYFKLFKQAQLGDVNNYLSITSDLVFLAQNLVFLKNQGELGIILPDGLFSSRNFEYFRSNLFLNYSVISIIQLPRRIFKKTDAQTHILILKKEIASVDFVKLCVSDNNGVIRNELLINKENLIKRADYSYHSLHLEPNINSCKTLKQLGAEIKRGKYSKKELVKIGYPFIHIGEIKKSYNISINNLTLNKNFDVEQGDIVMIRVGRSDIGKISIIRKGEFFVSDCIYRIRIPLKYREHALKALNSQFAKSWFIKHSKGVAAKLISQSDLYQFPVEV